MPIYEYRCRKCGHQFELMQRFSDQPLSKCPECSGRVDKLISHSTFRLKGAGWYATDYGGKSSEEKPSKKETRDTDSKGSSDKDEKKSDD